MVKLLVTRGVEGAPAPTCWVQASAPGPAGRRQRETGIDVILLDRGYDSDIGERAPWLLLGAKTLSYAVNMAALRYAHAQGADDVIFTSADGRVLEGPTSTVLLAHLETSDDGAGGIRTVRRLITPQLDSGILPGTSQGALFTAAKAAGWELGYGPLEPRTCTTPTPCGSSPASGCWRRSTTSTARKSAPRSCAGSSPRNSARCTPRSNSPPPPPKKQLGALRNMTAAAVRAGVAGVTFLGSNENRCQALTGRSATLPFAAGCLR